jgi:hypothetical protein
MSRRTVGDDPGSEMRVVSRLAADAARNRRLEEE